MDYYDLIVIGAGSAGVRAGRLAASAGLRTAVIEAREPGGTCVLRGCVPKKLLVYAGDDLRLGDPFDWPQLRDRVQAETRRLSGLYANTLAKSGADLLTGRAQLIGPDAVRVGTRDLRAGHILVAVGGEPIAPVPFGITSDDLFVLPQLPESITVYGAGYIGAEMAHILHAFGVRVRLAFRGQMLLRGFDADAVRLLSESYARAGIELLPGTPIDALPSDATVLWATGRRPLTADLGLENAGVVCDASGHIITDEFMRAAPTVFAAGDVVGNARERLSLTPIALHEADCIVDTLLGRPRRPDYADIPTAVFSRPELASVGITEAEAAAAPQPHAVYTTQFRPMRHALSGRAETIMMKLIVAPDDTLRGAHMVGDGAAEGIQLLAVAVKARMTKTQLSAVMPLHPTAAEEWITLRTPTRTV